jgi:Flp pilus assembly pilin Flp
MDMKIDTKNFRLKREQGSFTLEYASLVILLVVALLAMSFYLKNAMCGKMKMVGDTFGHGRQYERGVTVETETSVVSGPGSVDPTVVIEGADGVESRY